MNKRELNKNLRSRILPVRETYCIRNFKVRVLRARTKESWRRGNYTEVDIVVCGEVKSAQNNWLSLGYYGPRSIRTFIRNHSDEIPQTVNEWTKLWGLTNDKNITLKNIKIVKTLSEV